MAFESVDVDSLRSAISSCVDSINYNDSLELIGDIGNDNVWNSESRTHLKNALIKLTNTRYQQLKSKLSVANQVADLIAEYKKLEQENKDCNSRISSLEPQLYYTESYIAGYETDENGNTHEIWGTRTVLDTSVQNEINKLKKKIKENKIRMKEIEGRVSSLIGGM